MATVPVVTFVAGALATPALADLYGAARDRLFGEPVTSTEVRQLNVVGYDGRLSPDYEVESVERGECPSGSQILATNPNAYRCSFKHFVADPCLALEGGSAVACLAGPWELAVTRVDLADPVAFDPAAIVEPGGRPWALEVQDPRDARVSWHCLTLTGATTPIAGHQPGWWCVREDGTGTGRALDDLRAGEGGVQEVLFHDADEPELRTAKVARVWY